jgi:hypothetical protein
MWWCLVQLPNGGEGWFSIEELWRVSASFRVLAIARRL